MKIKILCSFLCVAVAQAPLLGRSNTSDELWHEQSGLNAQAALAFAELDNKVLSTEKLLKFISALPQGIGVANRVMNDATKTIHFYSEPYHNGDDMLLSYPNSFTLAGWAAIILGVGGTAYTMHLDHHSSLTAQASRKLSALSIAGLLSLGAGFSAVIYIASHRRFQHTLEHRPARPNTLIEAEQTFLISSQSDSQGPSHLCNVVTGLDNAKIRQLLPYASVQVQYTLSHCMEPNEQVYSGSIYIHAPNKKNTNNATDATIQVQADQGVFEFNPDKQIFERLDSAH